MESVHLQFAEPQWLWLAWLGPVSLLALFWYSTHARRRQLALLAAPHFLDQLTQSHSPGRRGFKHALLVLALTGIGLALARPQWGDQENAGEASGADVMFVVDCSQSMLAADVTPSRLQRSKLAILDFVQHRARGRVGLVAFAGQAFLQCPLTFDHGAFEDALTALDEKIIPVPGTDIGRALNEALQGMEKLDRRKVMLLITDGEDLEKGGVRSAQMLATNGVVVFTLGVGTPAGAPIQVVNEQGKPEFLRDAKGEVVRSRLDETTLRAVARITHGNYFPLGPLGEGLHEAGSVMETMDLKGDPMQVRRFAIERFHYPVAAVLGLIVLESLIGTRRHIRTPAALLATGLMVTVFANDARSEVSSSPPVSGPAVETSQTTPVTARGFFNAGTQKISRQQWRDAELLLQSALASQQEKLQPPTLYNLGHARFAAGVEELKKHPDGKTTKGKAQAVSQAADAAVQAAADALVSQDLQKMLTAYQRGRGVRRELKTATAAVRRAMEVHGNVLMKWQRASGDFKSAVQLQEDYADARHNADVVDRHIAKLVDSLRELQQMKNGIGRQSGPLNEALKALRGKLPAPEGNPGPGDEDEDDLPFGPQPGTQESAGRDGQEMKLTPEQAGQLLDGFKLGGDARLPLGQESEAGPQDRRGRNW